MRGRYRHTGFYSSEAGIAGAWMRDKAVVEFTTEKPLKDLQIDFDFRELPGIDSAGGYDPSLGFKVKINGKRVLTQSALNSDKNRLAQYHLPGGALKLEIELTGVGFSNFKAMLGRKWETLSLVPKSWRDHLQPFRKQLRNRSIVFKKITINGECLLDFDSFHNAFTTAYILNHGNLGLNILGWYHGLLGVAESARACWRAARAVNLRTAAVPLNVKLVGSQSPALFDDSLLGNGPYPISISHIDAPLSFDLLQNHADLFDDDHHKVGYWAWELPEFPDSWVRYSSVFDEIWCPSEFCRQALSVKLPVPVFKMPHAIEVPLVERTSVEIRDHFKLPQNTFLFLFTFDFNSYTPRKNPEAVIQAFREAFDGSSLDVGLVIKVHGKGYQAQEKEQLQQLIEGLPNSTIIDRLLTRKELTELQYTCDSFVSLHRSEGFGLAVAEMMALGKPVISTNWSATAEFLNESNGCPVRADLVKIERNIGPYSAGQYWADPDISHAAEYMQRIHQDSDFRQSISEKAQIDIKEHFSPQVIGKKYIQRVKAIALF